MNTLNLPPAGEQRRGRGQRGKPGPGCGGEGALGAGVAVDVRHRDH